MDCWITRWQWQHKRVTVVNIHMKKWIRKLEKECKDRLLKNQVMPVVCLCNYQVICKSTGLMNRTIFIGEWLDNQFLSTAWMCNIQATAMNEIDRKTDSWLIRMIILCVACLCDSKPEIMMNQTTRMNGLFW